MKWIVLSSILITATALQSEAQVGPGQGCDCCFIRYTYDNAGNRIKRDFYCEPLFPPMKQAPPENDSSGETVFAEETDWLIFPNPNSGVFEIKFGLKPDNFALIILDGQGKIVHTTTLFESVQQIDISGFAPGSYYVVVNDNRQNKTKKMIKRE